MASITWNVRIHGHKHRVVCKPEMNKYVFFVDDDHLTNIYRDQLKQLRYGAQMPVRICGQECLFVVWNELPDLVVDGIMQGRGEPFAQAKEKRRKAWIRAHRILRLIFLAAFGVLLARLIRVPMDTESMAKCISMCTTLVFLFFRSGYKIRRWREW